MCLARTARSFGRKRLREGRVGECTIVEALHGLLRFARNDGEALYPLNRAFSGSKGLSSTMIARRFSPRT
jgi:hypothetical protein